MSATASDHTCIVVQERHPREQGLKPSTDEVDGVHELLFKSDIHENKD